jgi:hypothetical protein
MRERLASTWSRTRRVQEYFAFIPIISYCRLVDFRVPARLDISKRHIHIRIRYLEPWILQEMFTYFKPKWHLIGLVYHWAAHAAWLVFGTCNNAKFGTLNLPRKEKIQSNLKITQTCLKFDVLASGLETKLGEYFSWYASYRFLKTGSSHVQGRKRTNRSQGRFQQTCSESRYSKPRIS